MSEEPKDTKETKASSGTNVGRQYADLVRERAERAYEAEKRRHTR